LLETRDKKKRDKLKLETRDQLLETRDKKKRDKLKLETRD
jgi:hypothetical protein